LTLTTAADSVLNNFISERVTVNSNDFLSLYLQWLTIRKSCMIYRTAPFFNDLERRLPTVSRSRHSLTLNISETVRHTDIMSLKY